MKLVSCDYEHPMGRTTAWGARVHFLELIEELVPACVGDLAGALKIFGETGIGELELYHKDRLTRRNYRDIGTLWRSIRINRCTCNYYDSDPKTFREKFIHESCAVKKESTWRDLCAAGVVEEMDFMFETSYVHYPKCPAMLRLRAALDGWRNRYNLTAEWCLESAFYTLDTWHRSRSEFKAIGFSTFGTTERSPYLKAIDAPPGLDDWNPEYEERDAFIDSLLTHTAQSVSEISLFENPTILRGVLNVVRREAETYCDDVEKHYRANGWEKIRDLRDVLKHLEWTVKFQVGGQTLTAIAEQADVTVPSVKKEVEKILGLIGLQKRPNSGPGRRRGQTESPTSRLLKSLGR